MQNLLVLPGGNSRIYYRPCLVFILRHDSQISYLLCTEGQFFSLSPSFLSPLTINRVFQWFHLLNLISSNFNYHTSLPTYLSIFLLTVAESVFFFGNTDSFLLFRDSLSFYDCRFWRYYCTFDSKEMFLGSYGIPYLFQQLLLFIQFPKHKNGQCVWNIVTVIH